MIDLVDKIIIYLAFGGVCSLGTYMLLSIHTLKKKAKLNMDFNSKVIVSLQETNNAIQNTQTSIKTIMTAVGVPFTEESEVEEVKEQEAESISDIKKMDYAG